MKGFKRMAAAAAALALVCAVALVAQAAGVVNKGAGPIGTPGSDKTIKAHVLALEIAVANLTTSLNNLQVRFSNLSSQVSTIAANNALLLDPFVRVQQGESNGLAGPHIFFGGANIHIISAVNGFAGRTDDSGNLSGLGNLIIGYDEAPALPAPIARGGSHNLVVGPGHNFSSFGGFVGGANNTVSGHDASVSGGENNKASGNFSVVSGGAFINATSLNQWAHP